MRSNGIICVEIGLGSTPTREFAQLWDELKESRPTVEQLRFVEGRCRYRMGKNRKLNEMLRKIISEVDGQISLVTLGAVRNFPRDPWADLIANLCYRTSQDLAKAA